MNAWEIRFAGSGKSALDGVILADTAEEAVQRAVQSAGLDPDHNYIATERS